MQHPSTPHQGHAEQNAAATAIFRQAAADGRHALNDAELRALLAGVGIRFDETPSPVHAPPGVEWRIGSRQHAGIRPRHQRRASAGRKGISRTLHCQKDRARVHAAAELTDAKDFLALSRRTLAYHRHAAAAVRGGWPLPDAQLEATFERLLALARSEAQQDAGAPFALAALTLDAVQAANG